MADKEYHIHDMSKLDMPRCGTIIRASEYNALKAYQKSRGLTARNGWNLEKILKKYQLNQRYEDGGIRQSLVAVEGGDFRSPRTFYMRSRDDNAPNKLVQPD